MVEWMDEVSSGWGPKKFADTASQVVKKKYSSQRARASELFHGVTWRMALEMSLTTDYSLHPSIQP